MGWAGEESCWLRRRLCGAGAEGWEEEEEKAEQRRFSAGELESQEERRPGRERGTEMRTMMVEETAAWGAGAPGASHSWHQG